MLGGGGGAPPRLLLLLPTHTYRADAFVDAAFACGVDLTVASEIPSSLEAQRPEGLLTLELENPAVAAAKAAVFAQGTPVDAVLGVDDGTVVAAAAISKRLGLRHTSVTSAIAARDKHEQRRLMKEAGVEVPDFSWFAHDTDPASFADWPPDRFPVVVKPVILSASRGVIRANDATELVKAFDRSSGIVREAGDTCAAAGLLVERFVPGSEFALDALVNGDDLIPLALFEKPEPMDGPYFEETIYITPPRLDEASVATLIACARRAVAALGIDHGAVHAELRLNDSGPWLIELAARPIGGKCARALAFDGGQSLEELVIRHALGETYRGSRARGPTGVMMLPIPGRGILERVANVDEAKSVPGITDVVITAHRGMTLIPLPEGSQYLGFAFARCDTQDEVYRALHRAHGLLDIRLA